jgi:hypothetical protein
MFNFIKWLIFVVGCFPVLLYAAPEKKVIPYWKAYTEGATIKVEHDDWQYMLDRYVTANKGIHLFSYSNVSNSDKKKLKGYLLYLASINPKKLNRAQQMAFWVNLYNASTVSLILEHYPVTSIKKIGSIISSPWDKKFITVNRKALSLNNIEHGILRPIFNDSRIHYVVNCASKGCPNLPKKALTSANAQRVLDRAARSYINHPRGLEVKQGRLKLSTLYKWYRNDFGRTKAQLVSHLSRYARPEIRRKIKQHYPIDYHYDWSLNEP